MPFRGISTNSWGRRDAWESRSTWSRPPPGRTIPRHRHPYDEVAFVRQDAVAGASMGRAEPARATSWSSRPVRCTFVSIGDGPLIQLDVHLVSGSSRRTWTSRRRDRHAGDRPTRPPPLPTRESTCRRVDLLLGVGNLHHLHFLTVLARAVHLEHLDRRAGPRWSCARSRSLLDRIPAALKVHVLPVASQVPVLTMMPVDMLSFRWTSTCGHVVVAQHADP